MLAVMVHAMLSFPLPRIHFTKRAYPVLKLKLRTKDACPRTDIVRRAAGRRAYSYMHTGGAFYLPQTLKGSWGGGRELLATV